jgi:hypothetical protein
VDNSQPKKRFPLGRVARLTFRALTLAMVLMLLVGWVVSYRGCASVGHGLRSGRWLTFGTYLGTFTISLADRNALGPRPMRGWGFAFQQWNAQFRELFEPLKPFTFQIGVSGELCFAVKAPY